MKIHTIEIAEDMSRVSPDSINKKIKKTLYNLVNTSNVFRSCYRGRRKTTIYLICF